MTKNLMPEIAKMLGVEMGERFKIDGFKVYRITQLGLVNDENFICNSELNDLLCGDVDIIKLPFKPQRGEKYWVWRRDFYNAKNVFVAQWIFWCGDMTDRMFYMLGNCYSTEQECLADTAMKERMEKMERCKW